MTKRHKYKLAQILQDLRHVSRISEVSAADAIRHLGKGSQKCFDEDLLRITVWNIYKGKGQATFHNDFSRILGMSDLVLAQEALLTPDMERAMHHDDFLTLHCASYQRADGLRDGLATLSRSHYIHDITKVASFKTEPVFRTPKSTLISFYPLKNGLSLMVVNVHARLFRSPKQSTDELQHLMLQLPIHEGPVILAGDFNTITVRYLEKTFAYLESHGFVHIAMENDPRGPFASLDHVFVRGLTSLSAKVLVDVTSSDHLPLYLTAKVPR